MNQTSALALMVSLLFASIAPVASANPRNRFAYRCAEAMSQRSVIKGTAFAMALDSLTEKESEQFSFYLEQLTEDVINEHENIPLLSKEDKEKILTDLLNSGDFFELVKTFIKHRELIADIAGVKIEEDSKQSLKNLAALNERYKVLSNLKKKSAAGKETSENPISAITSDSNVSEEDRTLFEELSVQASRRYETANTDKLSSLIDDLIDPSSGNDKSKAIALIIARMEHHLQWGNFNEINRLPVFPETLKMFSRGDILGAAFRIVEEAKLLYDRALANVVALVKLREVDEVRHSIANDIDQQITIQQRVMEEARVKAEPFLDIYEGVQQYLKLVVGGQSCGLNCRVNALRAFSILGSQDQGNFISAKIHDKATLPEIITGIADNIESESAKEQAKQILHELNEKHSSPHYFMTTNISLWKSKDGSFSKVNEGSFIDWVWASQFAVVPFDSWRAPILHIREEVGLTQSAELTRMRANRVQQKLSKVFSLLISSEYFFKFVARFYYRTGLDRTWLSSTFRGSRDKNEILRSAGTLLMINRSQLPLYVKIEKLNALIANNPQAAITVYRHPRFLRFLYQLESMNKIEEGDEGYEEKQEIDFVFKALFEKLEEGKTHPDASRPLDLYYEQPKLMYTLAAMLALASSMGLYEAENLSNYIPDQIWEIIDETQEPIKGVLEENPEEAAELKNVIERLENNPKPDEKNSSN